MAKNNTGIKIDIHGLTGEDGKKRVLKEISRAPAGTDKIIVIHGSNNGTVLRDAVRSLKNGRILQITPTFSNDGETTIYLKK